MAKKHHHRQHKMADDENACVRNIVKEIMRECYPRKITVNKNFVTFLTKLLLIDPNWGIDDDFFNQRENVQQFVSYVTEGLLGEQDRPKLVTMKIQFYFDCNMEYMDYMVDMHKKKLKHRLAPLKDDIFVMTDVSEKETMELLTKKVVTYLVLASGLGNPTKPKIFDECHAALRSVIEDGEVEAIASAPKAIKQEKLDSYIKVVAGIRLFNKDCGKGGEGIDNLPELLFKAIEVVRNGTEVNLLSIMEKVNILTTVVDKCYILKPTYQGLQMQLMIPDVVMKCVPFVDIEYMKELLVFFRQYELIIRRIIEELEKIYFIVEETYEKMGTLLRTIHETVYMRIAIPVTTVFPLFEQLFAIWNQFQDLVLLLSRFNSIMNNLDGYARQTHYDQYLIDQVVIHTGSMTDAQRLAKTAHLTLVSSNQSIEVFKMESIKNVDTLELEYLGFCCWTLVETDGALIPGNPTMGIARYEGKNYVFAHSEAFEAFCKEPELYINHVLALARRKPQLINFFQLQKPLEKVFGTVKLVKSQEDLRLCENKAVQADENLLQSNIDPNYRWNIWDLKREALTMANISSAVTVSTQSDKGCSKNFVKTQTYYTKEVSIQTNSDTYTNVPKPSQFIYGLLGRKDDKQVVIDLTKPVKD